MQRPGRGTARPGGTNNRTNYHDQKAKAKGLKLSIDSDSILHCIAPAARAHAQSAVIYYLPISTRARVLAPFII